MMEWVAVKSVIDQYLDMLTEKQKEDEGDTEEKVHTILEESEEQAKGLDFLLEKVERLIGDDDSYKKLLTDDDEEEYDDLSGDTISDEDLIGDEE